jgi:hypothetical protein
MEVAELELDAELAGIGTDMAAARAIHRRFVPAGLLAPESGPIIALSGLARLPAGRRREEAHRFKVGPGHRYPTPNRHFLRSAPGQPDKWRAGERWGVVGDEAAALYHHVSSRMLAKRLTRDWREEGASAPRLPRYNTEAAGLVARLLNHFYGAFFSRPLVARDVLKRIQQRTATPTPK